MYPDQPHGCPPGQTSSTDRREKSVELQSGNITHVLFSKTHGHTPMQTPYRQGRNAATDVESIRIGQCSYPIYFCPQEPSPVHPWDPSVGLSGVPCIITRPLYTETPYRFIHEISTRYGQSRKSRGPGFTDRRTARLRKSSVKSDLAVSDRNSD